MHRGSWAVMLVVAFACGPGPDALPGPVGAGPSTSVQRRSTAQVPLVGGTVTLAGGGDFAVVSDAERDVLHVVNVRERRALGRLPLPEGSLPGPGAEDGRGNVRVVLRGTGQLVTVRVASATLARTESVCPEPRGVAWDPGQKAVLVACAGGELVTLPAEGSLSVRRFDGELRDVVVSGGRVRLSTFRSAELLTVEPSGTPQRTAPPEAELPSVAGAPTAFVPTVAWRTLATRSGQTVMVHQRSVRGDIDAIRTGLPPVAVPYYRNPCDSTVVRTAVTVFEGSALVGSTEVPGVVPIDAAVTPSGELLIASAGTEELVRLPLNRVQGFTPSGVCGIVNASRPAPTEAGAPGGPVGVPVGVAAVSDELVLVHSRAPNTLLFVERGRVTTSLALTPDLPATPGVELFHGSSGGIACASCHPEGQEDGHTWTFFGERRRTQALSGGLRATAPYHWQGDLSTLDALVSDTFVARMGGAPPPPEVVASLEAFLDGIAAPRPPTRDAPVDMARGRAAFVKAGCVGCHRGERLTLAVNADVGTGGAFQPPSLKGLAMRGPWMHDGCARTLAQRVNDPACGGDRHGDVSGLTASERDALVAYLGQL
ncbi:MAG: c-type cytochrome [Myxococcaceae bacterium]|nr:c-type cytochrome [Myxococcaceae bacterium]